MLESYGAIADQINVVLVGAGVRPACLLEELGTADISHILARYPDLKVSRLDRGLTIVSRRTYKAAEVRSDAALGKILGFPCAGDYEELKTNKDPNRYGLVLFAEFKNGRRIHFFAYVCKNTRSLPALKAMATAATNALHRDPLFVDQIVAVHPQVDHDLRVIDLIKRIQSGKWRDISAQITHYLANLGFTRLDFKDFHMESPRDRGILLAVLAFARANPWQILPADRMFQFIKEWEKDILAVLKSRPRHKTRRNRKIRRGSRRHR